VLFPFLGGFVGSSTRDNVVGQVGLMVFIVFLGLVLQKLVNHPMDLIVGGAEDIQYHSYSSRQSRDQTTAY